MTSLPSMPQEIPLKDLSGDLLRARVARAQMYLIEMTPKERTTSSPPEELQREHIEYLLRLEHAGLLFGAGPIEAGGVIQAAEVAVIAATSMEQAERISQADPLHAAGLRVNSVRSYTINEGVACYFARAMASRARSIAAPFVEEDAVRLSAEELLARAAGVQLYLVPLEPTERPRPPEDVATMDAHFVWLRDNEMSAKLLGCGPLQSAKPLTPGVWGGGLGILATSRAEADDIARREPSGVAGYRELSVIPWTLDYGLAAPIAEALATLNSLPS